MIKSLVIIGIGSFGGFFAENLSRLYGLKTLTIIDPDVVELKNVNTSVYRQKDVGKYKVEALEEIIKFHTDIDIIKCNLNYEEGKIKLPPRDLVFDCRDIITTRKQEIDARFYISLRKLVIDCRNKFNVINERKGRYIDSMSKTDIMNAAFSAFMLVSNGIIFDLVKRRVVHSIDLDDSGNKVSKELEVCEKKDDYIIDNSCVSNKLANLSQSLPRISKARTKVKESIPVYVGSKEFPYSVSKIPECNIVSYDSTATALTEIVNNVPLIYDNYVIRLVSKKNETYIELLPETGGA